MEGFGLPGLVEMVQESGGGQDHQENTTHVFKGVNAQVFDIQASLLVQAVSMLDVGAETPGDKNGLGIGRGEDGSVGEQAEVAVKVRVMNSQQPQRLWLIR